MTFDLVPRSRGSRWAHRAVGRPRRRRAEDDGEVVGFGSLSPYRDRPAYSTSVEDSVYVRRDHQGQGVGQGALGECSASRPAHGFHAVVARIVGGHEASIVLDAHSGFESSAPSARSAASSAAGSTCS